MSQDSKMNQDALRVFPLKFGTKIPKCKWKDYKYVLRKNMVGSYGLIPAINGCCVIDLDFAKNIPDEIEREAVWSKHPLSSLLKKQKATFVVKTPSGGLHYYFKSDDDFNFTVKHI